MWKHETGGLHRLHQSKPSAELFMCCKPDIFPKRTWHFCFSVQFQLVPRSFTTSSSSAISSRFDSLSLKAKSTSEHISCHVITTDNLTWSNSPGIAHSHKNTHSELMPTWQWAWQQRRPRQYRMYYKGEECAYIWVCTCLKRGGLNGGRFGRSERRLEAFCLHLSAHRPELIQQQKNNQQKR